MIFNKTYLMY